MGSLRSSGGNPLVSYHDRGGGVSYGSASKVRKWPGVAMSVGICGLLLLLARGTLIYISVTPEVFITHPDTLALASEQEPHP